MALIEINKNPSSRELRQFAGIWFPAFCGLIGGLIWTKAGLPAAAIALWVAAGLIAVTGMRWPQSMRPLWIGWMYAAFPIGWTISHLLMAAIYYLIITPIGGLMRICGKLTICKHLNPAAKTYWEPHRQAEDPSRYFRQF
jgi:hypothetical protein